MPERRRLRVTGTVQGVGFRPFVYRLAADLGLAGWVGNDSLGVILEAEGPPGALDRLAERLAADDPSKRALRDAVEAQASALRRGSAQLDRFYTEMERIAVELGNVRAELLSVSAASEAAGQQRLAADVRDLREQMGAVSAGMTEALSEAPDA